MTRVQAPNRSARATSPVVVITNLLRGGFATVDVDNLASNERRPVRNQKQDRVGDLFWAASTMQRDTGNKAGFPVGTTGEAIEHRSLDRTGRSRIGANPERGSLRGRRLGQPLDSVLAGDVKRSVRRAPMAHGR